MQCTQFEHNLVSKSPDGAAMLDSLSQRECDVENGSVVDTKASITGIRRSQSGLPNFIESSDDILPKANNASKTELNIRCRCGMSWHPSHGSS